MMNNWKQRYSQRLVPIPNGFEQSLRHMAEHGWTLKGGLKSFHHEDLGHLHKHIDKIHDVTHGWYSSDEEADEFDPTAYFHHISGEDESYDDRETDHDHGHPESGKPITGVEKRYTDD